MHNKIDLLIENTEGGEISLALIGIIMKKINKVAFKTVYEKLLKDGDSGRSDFFKQDSKFTINNYDKLLDPNDTSTAPTGKALEIKDDEGQRNLLVNKEFGKTAANVLSNTETEKIDKDTVEKFKVFFSAEDNVEEAPVSFQNLILKYDLLKKSTNTHIFPHTQLENYFVKKRTGLEKTYNINEATSLVLKAAIIFYHLKKIRSMILRVQKASRELPKNLQMQKVKPTKDTKTISDIITEQVDSQINDSQVDNLIKSFVIGKGKMGLNPFALTDELLFSVYGKDKILKFMKQAREIHDELNEVSEYILAALKSRKLDTSADSTPVTGIEDPNESKVIKNAIEIYKQKLETKYIFKTPDGEQKDISPQVLNILDSLANGVLKNMKKTDEEPEEEQ